MKSRKVVTRSGRGFRGYFPSKKLNRMVEYESLLERDAMYLFECSPGILSYKEQPELIMYEHECITRKYYPDFAVTLNSGAVVHVEIKPQIKLEEPQLASKFLAIINRYENHPSDFMILTDTNIRREPLFSNLILINSVKKFHIEISEFANKAKALLQTNISYTPSDFEAIFGKAEVLMMLERYIIFCDFNQPIPSPTNFLRLPTEADHDTVYF